MKVLIATPSLNRTPCCEYQQSMVRTMSYLAAQQVEAHLVYIGGDAFIDHARDHIVNLFMQTDCTDLLMIDDDQGWNVENVMQLLVCEKPVAAGVVIGREGDGKWHVVPETDEEGNFTIDNGLISVKQVGAAFMRIKREAIEKMIAAYPEDYYMTGEQKVYALFKTVIENHEFIGEDVAFCRRWKSLGEQVYVFPDMTFQHVGRQRWEGNFFHHLMANQPQGQVPVTVVEIGNAPGKADETVH
jgi:hypothetical protein